MYGMLTNVFENTDPSVRFIFSIESNETQTKWFTIAVSVLSSENIVIGQLA